MPAEFQPVFADAYTQLHGAIVDGLDGKFDAFLDLANGPVKVGVAIYIVIFGFAVMRGAVAVPAREFVYQALKLGLGVFLAFSLYSSNIAGAVSDGLPTQITAAAGGGTGNPGETFDDLYKHTYQLTVKIQMAAEQEAKNYDFTQVASKIKIYLTAALAVVLILMSSFIALALGFVVLIVATFALALLAVVGPLFVAAIIFESTRSFFFAWLNVIVNYLMLLALTVLIVAAVVGVGDDFVNVATLDYEQIIPIMVKVSAFYLVCFVLFLLIPGIASGLGGGAASGINAFAGGFIGSAAGAAARSASGAGTRTIGNVRSGYQLARTTASRARAGGAALTSRLRSNP